MAQLAYELAVISQTATFTGPIALGNASTDTIGFFGSTPIVRPTHASQTTVATGAASALVTTVATTLVTAGFGNSLGVFTSAAAIVNWGNALNVLIAAVDTLGSSHNAIKNALAQTTGLGLITGS